MASADILERLSRLLVERRDADPAGSYVARLYADGTEAILKKVGEEATETMLAGSTGDDAHLVREVADLWFHTLVLLAHRGVEPGAVLEELERRSGRSGLQEKAARDGERR